MIGAAESGIRFSDAGRRLLGSSAHDSSLPGVVFHSSRPPRSRFREMDMGGVIPKQLPVIPQSQ